MSGTGFDDTVQFRAGAETNASEVVDDVRLSGITVGELHWEGLKEMLQRTLSSEDTIQIYRRYEAGELEDDVVQVLLGDDIDEIDRKRAAFEAAMDLDINGVVQDWGRMAAGPARHPLIVETGALIAVGDYML